MTDQTPTRPDNIDGLIERLRTVTDGATELQDKQGAVIGYDCHLGNIDDVLEEAAQALSYLRWVEGEGKQAVPPGANPSGELSPPGEIFAGQQPGGSGGFQSRVEPWMRATFGDMIPFDKTERGDRLLEEVFELLQSGGYEQSRVRELCNYTWDRPPGEPSQEVGGVMVTLAAYCLAFGLDMHEAGETELARIWTKVEAIRAKQAAKPRGIALPIDPNGGAS